MTRWKKEKTETLILAGGCDAMNPNYDKDRIDPEITTYDPLLKLLGEAQRDFLRAWQDALDTDDQRSARAFHATRDSLFQASESLKRSIEMLRHARAQPMVALERHATNGC